MSNTQHIGNIPTTAHPLNPTCIACDTRLSNPLFSVTDIHQKATFTILRCTHCTLEMTHPQPDNMSAYYTTQYHGNRHGFTATYCARRRLKWVNQFYKGKKGKLLDIGCGEGTFLLQAKKSGWDVTGTELSSAVTNNLIQVYTDIDQVQAVAPFDCITLWHSFEHMPNPDSMLSKIDKLLSSEGILFIAVPNAQGLQATWFKKHWLHRDIPLHLYHFGKKSLVHLLQIKKYKIIKFYHQEFEYDLLGWSQSALNCLLKSPNIFFNLLTGRGIGYKTSTKLFNWLGGCFFSLLALPLIPLSAMLGKGGTIILAARKHHSVTRSYTAN